MEDRKSRYLDPAIYLLAWLLFTVLAYQVFVTLGARLSRPTHRYWYFFNSDSLVFAALYRDVFIDGFRWSGWHISNAPFYLEMLLYFLLRLVTGNFVYAHCLGAVVQPVILVLVAQFVAAAVAPGLSLRGHSVMVLVGCTVAFLFAQNRAAEFVAFFWPGRHQGVTIAAIVGLALLIRLARRNGWGDYGLLCAVCFASALADPLFLVVFVVPALLLTVLMPLLRIAKARNSALVAVGLVLPSILGSVVARLTTHHRTSSRFTTLRLGEAAVHLHRFWRDIIGAGGSRKLLIAIAAVWLAGSVIAAVFLAFHGRKRGWREMAGPWIFISYTVLMSAASIGAVVLTGSTIHGGYFRYLLSVFTFPLLGAALLLALLCGRSGEHWRRGVAMAAIASLAVATGVTWKRPAQGAATVWTYYPEMTKCLDRLAEKYDLRYGMADYWFAKYNTMFSRKDLRIYQVRNDLKPYHHVSNIDWYLGAPGARYAEPEYTFVLLGGRSAREGIRRETVVARYGEPAHTEQCCGHEVLIYNRPSDEAFRRHFDSYPWLRRPECPTAPIPTATDPDMERATVEPWLSP